MRKDIIKPIETEYNGYLFRSKLEAQWAVVFDPLGIRYEYEPEGFELEDGTKYLPDFYFPDQDTYGEVKPDRPGALEELFDKSLKFVENGVIERLIILPNIPAATKKDPVWWVPIVVKNPFEPFSDKNWPFSNLLVTKAMLNEKRISMNDYPTIHQINIDPEFFAIDIKSFIDDSRHHRKPNKWVVKSLHDMFLQAIPSREMNYFLGCQILDPDMTMEDILAEKEVENAPAIMRAYKKARQARFDHGQTPEAKRAG